MIAPEAVPTGCLAGDEDLCRSEGASTDQAMCVFGSYCSCSNGFVCEDTMSEGNCAPQSGGSVHCIPAKKLLVTLKDARSLADLDAFGWNTADPFVAVDVCGVRHRTLHHEETLNVKAEDWVWKDGFDGKFDVPASCDEMKVELWDEDGWRVVGDDEWKLHGDGMVKFKDLLVASHGEEAHYTLEATEGGELDVSVQWVS